MSKVANLLKGLVSLSVMTADVFTTYTKYLKKLDQGANILHWAKTPVLFNPDEWSDRWKKPLENFKYVYGICRGQLLSHTGYFVKFVGTIYLEYATGKDIALKHITEFALTLAWKVIAKVCYFRRNFEWKEETIWLNKFHKYDNQLNDLASKLTDKSSQPLKADISKLREKKAPTAKQLEPYKWYDAPKKMLIILLSTMGSKFYNEGSKAYNNYSKLPLTDIPDYLLNEYVLPKRKILLNDAAELNRYFENIDKKEAFNSYLKPFFSIFDYSLIIASASIKINKGEAPTKDALIKSRKEANTDLTGDKLRERVIDMKVHSKALKFLTNSNDESKNYSKCKPETGRNNKEEYLKDCKKNLYKYYKEKYAAQIEQEKNNLSWSGRIKSYYDDISLVVKNSAGIYGYSEPTPAKKPNYARAIVVAEKHNKSR